MRIKLLTVLAAVLLLLPCTGCMHPVQLAERAIVQGIGVDYEGGTYLLTLALYDPQGVQAGGEGQKKSPLWEGEGATVAEALEDAKLKAGKDIFWGQSKLIVLGGGAAAHGLPGALGFFNDSFEARPNIDVVMAPGGAGELLQAQTREAPSVFMRDLLENGEHSGYIPRTKLMDAVGALKGGGNVCMPLVELEETNGEQSLRLTGLALYRNGAYCGRTDLEAARGVLWLRGELEKTSVAVPGTAGERVTLAVVNARAKIKPGFVGEIPHFTVECSLGAHLSGENAPGGGMAQAARAAEQAGAEAVRREIEAALEQTALQNACDVLGLAQLLRQAAPEWYRQNAENYNALLPEFTFSITVDTRVTRYGLQG